MKVFQQALWIYFFLILGWADQAQAQDGGETAVNMFGLWEKSQHGCIAQGTYNIMWDASPVIFF